MLQGIAGIVYRRTLSERRSGDGNEAAAAGATGSVLSAQSSTDSQPDADLAAIANSAVDSSHESSSSAANVDQLAQQQFDAVTEQFADLEISSGLRRRQRNGQHRDVQDTA